MAHKWAGWLHNTARLRIPNALQQGAKSAVAHKWCGRQHNPCRLGGPQRFKAGDKISRGPQVGPGGYITPAAWGSPTLQSEGPNQQWPTSGPRWLHNPCRLAVPNAGDKISSGPQMGPGGYVAPASCATPNASQRGTKSVVAHE